MDIGKREGAGTRLRAMQTAPAFRVLAAAVCMVACALAMVAGLLGNPATARADEQAGTDASFTLAAINVTGSGYLIEPMQVTYTSGQTLRQALEGCGQGITFGSGSQAFITGVNGLTDANGASIRTYYTGGWRDGVAYDFPASEVKAMFITTNATAPTLEEGHADLLTQMGRYLSATNNVRNYTPASAAYRAAYQGLISADGSTATQLASDLKSAMDTYQSILDGTTYAVNATVTRGGSALAGAQVTLTDAYGNVTTATNGQAKVVAGTYTLEAATADGLWATQKTVEVSSETDGQTVAVDLPTADWFGSVQLLDGKGASKVPVSMAGAIASRNLTFYVPDYTTELNCLFVRIKASAAVPSRDSSYSVEAHYTNNATGAAYVNKLAFESDGHNLDYLLSAGTTGADLTFEIHHQASDGAVQIERCPATVVRTPTLSALTVAQDTTQLLGGFDPYQIVSGQHSDSYDIKTTGNTLTFGTTTFGGADAGYSVEVNGRAAAADGTATVQVDEGTTAIPVVVSLPDGTQTTYTVNVTCQAGVPVTVTHDAGVGVQVENAAGGIEQPSSSTSTQATYQLFSGETYSYISTKDTYYHASNTFVAQDGSTVAAATPREDQIVKNIRLKRGNVPLTNANYYEHPRDVAQSDGHRYVFDVPDTETSTWVRLETNASAWAYDAKAKADVAQFTVNTTWNSMNDGSAQALPWSTKSRSGQERLSWSSSGEKSFDPKPVTFNANDKYDKVNGRYQTYNRNDNGTYTMVNDGTGAYVSYKDQTCLHASLSYFVNKGANANVAHLTVTSTVSDAAGTTYYQDITIEANRRSTLEGLGASFGGANLQLTQTATLGNTRPATKFSGSVTEYTTDVPETATSLDVNVTFLSPATGYPELVGGYTARIAGGTPSQVRYDDGQTQTISVPLNTSIKDQEDIRVTVGNEAPGAVDTTYVIHVVKHPAVKLKVNVTPADATVSIIDASNNARIWPDADGTYLLTDSFKYRWSAGALGYVSRGSTAGDELVASEGMADLNVTLEKAEPNTKLNTSLTSFWPTFRIGENNVSYVDSPTPSQASQSVLYWAKPLGQGFDSGATGCPILVDGYLYSYGSAAGQAMIYKLDATTGETVAQNTMVGASSFSLTPLTYADGMLFVALAGGKVEAFDAQTLESLWVYTDPLGGQPNCPVTYHDGYVYTGFWNAYTGMDADFVCLTATDEDPSKPGHEVQVVNEREQTVITDAKQALWTHATEAGYYWAGAIARDNYVLMGADDGLSESSDPNGTGVLYSFDAKTGRVIDTLKGTDTMPFTGDVRTQITYDEQTGYYYFMTKNGYLNRMKVNDDGTFVKGSFSRLDLSQSTAIGVGMCTSTPAIYNGRAYVGVSGTGQFTDYSGHHLAVVDLSTFTIAYTVETKGYVQATPLISTHYASGSGSDSGYAYIYMIENCQPGEMRIIRDKPGMTAPDEWSLQDEDCTNLSAGSQGTRKLARTLFAPTGSEAQYAICSPICDEDGFIYFKNDSARMMCVGPTMTSLEVTQQPNRTAYATGEVFDPTGMKVVAHYSNGATRDVSKYVTCSSEALTPRDTTVTVRFEHTRYQNTSDYTKTDYQAPVDYQAPTATVNITVNDNAAPSITTTTLPAGYAGSILSPARAYDETLAASAYPAVTSWTIVRGSLPDGLTFDTTTGRISGTPTKGGSWTFAVTATNANGTSDERELTIDVQKPPQISFPLSDADLAVSGTVGVGMTRPYTLAATGYPAPTWKVYLGALPDGLTLDAATGQITGRPTKAGTYTVQFTADNGVLPSTNTQPVTFTIAETASLELTTTSLPTAQVDQEYTAQLACNATQGISWSYTGELPAGLVLDAATGVISGTPTETGTYTITATVNTTWGQSASRELTIVVGQAPEVTTSSLPAALVGQPYTATLAATGYPAPAITVAGLPDGLTLADNGDGTATISGTPTATGDFSVAVTASNGMGDGTAATATLALQVQQAPAIATASLPGGTAGSAYSATVEATGYPTPAIAAADLPEGLALADNGDGTATISGTPGADVVGTHQVTITAANGAGDDAQVTLELAITAAPEPAAITTTELDHATAGKAYAGQVAATGTQVRLAATGLPEGLAMGEDGTITGTPAATGHYAVHVTATATIGEPATADIALDVYSDGYDTSTNADATATTGQDFSYQVSAAGYPAANSYALAGTLPAGLSFDAATGVLSGAPEAAGTYPISGTVTGAAGTSTFSFVLTVADRTEPPAIVTTSLPAATLGQPYTATVQATGLPTPAITAAGLPEGLTLTDNGDGTATISGTPTATGDSTIALTASNSVGTATATLALQVQQAPAIATASLPGGTADSAYSATIETTGYPTPAITAADLPAGLALTDNGDGTATISGTPSAAGDSTITLTASNGVGADATATLALTIAEPPAPEPERLAGTAEGGSAGTAAAIAAKAFEGQTVETVVIARNDTYFDALAGAGLAGALDAPILLTDSSTLSPDCASEIQKFGARRAVILGGNNAVSPRVAGQLASLGLKVDRVAGDDVYGTSMEVTRALLDTGNADMSQAIVVNPTSFADAVSISGWAYRNHVPVMLQTWGDTAADRGYDAKAQAILAGRHLIVCGGTSAVSDESVSSIDPNFERLGGATLYDTSRAIADWEISKGGMSASSVTVASAILSYNGVDALAASALAGREGGVVLLAQSNPNFPYYEVDTALGFVHEHRAEVRDVYVLGGSVANTDALYRMLEEALAE